MLPLFEKTLKLHFTTLAMTSSLIQILFAWLSSLKCFSIVRRHDSINMLFVSHVTSRITYAQNNDLSDFPLIDLTIKRNCQHVTYSRHHIPPPFTSYTPLVTLSHNAKHPRESLDALYIYVFVKWVELYEQTLQCVEFTNNNMERTNGICHDAMCVISKVSRLNAFHSLSLSLSYARCL